MQRPAENFNSRTHHNPSGSLPLFRPEAILHQQQKFYGEIILLRPLSFTLLSWLVLAVLAGVSGVLVFGHYTEKLHLRGKFIAANDAVPDRSTLQAELTLPTRWLPLVHPGTSLLIRCRTCPAQTLQQTGTVTGISDAPLEVLQAAGSAPAYRVTVSLPPQPAQSNLGPLTQSGMSVEAEIPLGRKPLIRWFFERSGS